MRNGKRGIQKIYLTVLFRGQSYKDVYTLGQIYKCILKHENNAP